MSIEAPGQGETRINRIVTAVRRLCEGRSNATGVAKLTPGATTTAVPFANCGMSSIVLLSPMSASAASAGAWVSAVTAGQFIISHTSSAATDRVMGFACVG